MPAQWRADFVPVLQLEEHAFDSPVGIVYKNALHAIRPPLANT